jgi:hypothetical protein
MSQTQVSIFDAIEILDRDEFMDYLKRLVDKLYEAWIPVIVTIRDGNTEENILKKHNTLKDAIDALDLLMNLVVSANSTTWRRTAKDFIALNADRMKPIGWRLNHD